jgi:hypothetical protein
MIDYPDALPDPGSTSLPVKYRQGVIVEWNPLTLENKIRVGGEGGPVFENLPVLGVAEVATYRPGDVVGLHALGSTMAIIGQLVIPGSQAAADAVALLPPSVVAAFDTSAVSTTSATYVSLGGPSVTGTVRPSGRVLVLIGALITNVGEVVGGQVGDTGAMSVELSGANVLAASDQWDYALGYGFTPNTLGVIISTRACSAHLFEGLDPGETTFEAMYHSGAGGLTADFADRTLAVFFL